MKVNHTPQTIAQWCQDILGLAVECEDAYRAAWSDARAPARHPDLNGGGRPDGYSDPTAMTAIELVDLLDSVAGQLLLVRDDLSTVHRRLDEWGPVKQFAKRRCGERDCARGHHAQGLCQTHYRREQRKAS